MLCNFSAHLSRRSRKGPGSTPMMELLKSGPQEKSQARVKVKCRERRQEEEVDSGVGGRLFKKKKKKKKRDSDIRAAGRRITAALQTLIHKRTAHT